ncbi:M50 family metallopeptidase [Desulfatibacillum aliphaticivorans]|uniref:M50 family metallopeptidase n=1 Tax=Desulfatibacillum aliphaticivorans TaxID=218208 RepID=UPI0003FBBB58|nr:M50 family metallopeptidase [Desulfatibacillum aliphaticivorans]
MLEILQNIGIFALDSLKTTGMILLMIMGPGMLFALIMNSVSTRLKSELWNLLGRKLYLAAFGWLGVSVHELGHAVMCLLFGHKINKLQLFAPDQKSGTLGAVNHSFNPRNPYQVVGNFFIALGPVILGVAVIWAAAHFLLPHGIASLDISVKWSDFRSLDSFLRLAASSWDAAKDMLDDLFTKAVWSQWQTWVFTYILICVGSGISLSWSDISGGIEGFLAFFVLLFIAVLIAAYLDSIPTQQIKALSRAIANVYPFMLFALALNAMLAVSVFLLNTLKESIKS